LLAANQFPYKYLPMRSIILLCCIVLSSNIYAQPTKTTTPTLTLPKQITLPNGWSLSPAGRSIPLGDLPLNIAVSSSQRYIAVTNNGQSVQSIQLIDTKTERTLDQLIIPKSWYGLKFSKDEKFLYASGGNDNMIRKYAVDNNKLVLVDSIVLGKKWPNAISPTGLDIDETKQLMYVVTKEDSSLYIIDLPSKNTVSKIFLGAEAFTCVLSKDARQLYITCWGCDKLLIFDTRTRVMTGEVAVGDNPNDVILSKNNKYAFVANANDNSVSIIDLNKRAVIETLNAALFPDSRPGSTTNAVALSADEKTLYIANADNNCLGVFDVSTPGLSKSKGFIPVGWYPTNVKVIGKKIFVANGKGFSSLPNPTGPNPVKRAQKVSHHAADETKAVTPIGGLFKGTMSIIDVPTEKQLALYSKQVYQNTPYSKSKELLSKGEAGNPIPMKVGEQSPIKYVFYVIKENRTYDQVLGDMKEGNGDTSLVLFGENITPNLHALAREFVLLDNFFVDGEVSMDGHNWTMGAYATDYLEKTWPTSYGQRGGGYSGEGEREIANNKGGFIWDHCKRAGVSYRTYGEFANRNKVNLPALKGHSCTYYDGFNMSVKDTTRFQQWKRDFDSLLAINKVPQFNSVRFGNDHTEGLKKGRPTPFAHVADNDLAVGMFIEYLSKSPIWKETAILIVEDDAQNGADHVDAHRSTAYLAGGFVKRNFVDHTAYSTTSFLRTIELILGIPPMTQYDAAATPLWRCFTNKANLTPFTTRPINVDLNDRNTAVNEWQRRSEKFNLASEDAVPDLEFNIVLWHAVKGSHVPFPGPKRAGFLKVKQEKDDDD
jgi:DNA-binding beta-propeller fold protein YncE